MIPFSSYPVLELEEKWNESTTFEWLRKRVACGGHTGNSGAVLYNILPVRNADPSGFVQCALKLSLDFLLIF